MFKLCGSQTSQFPLMFFFYSSWQSMEYALALAVALGTLIRNYRHAHKHQTSHELKKADKIRGHHEEDDLSEWIRAPIYDQRRCLCK
jgi:hypothetical protein